MGWMVTIAARYKTKEVIAFKTSTNFFDANVNSPHLLNEDYLRSKVEEYNFLRDNELPENAFDDYDSRKGIVAPYEYGIVLFDYFNNTIISSNNYAPTIRGNSARLLEEYVKFLPSGFILKITKYGSDDVQIVNIKENRFSDVQEVHLINMALKHNAVIKLNDVEVKHDGTIESVLEVIYNISLKNKSVDEQIEIIKGHLAAEFMNKGGNFTMSLSDYGNISFEYPGFNIIEYDNSLDAEIIHDYLNDNGFILSDYETEKWQEQIEYCREKKSK